MTVFRQRPYRASLRTQEEQAAHIDMKQRQIDFEHGDPVNVVMQAGVPMLVGQVLNLLYSIVDRMYIGRIPEVGTLALGGIGLCFPVILMIMAFANLYGFGGAPLCAMERGRGNRDRAEFIMNSAATILLTLGIILCLLGYLTAEPVLRALGASENTLPFAMDYLQIYLIGTIPFMFSTGLNPYINAQGFAQTGMMTVFIGAAANIVLDPFFIFVLGLGIRGAAIATVISQVLSAAFAIGFLKSAASELHLRFLPLHSLDLPLVGEMTGLGLVNFIMTFTNSLVAIVCNTTLSAFGGDLAVSVYTIISSVRSIVDVPLLAFANGAGPALSYAYGAKQFERLKTLIRVVLTLCCSFSLVLWILISFFPRAFIGIFTSDPALLTAAVPGLHIYFFAFVFQSFQTVAQSTFKALGKKRRAIFFSLFRKVIMVVPLTLILPHIAGLGVNGVYMAEPISNVIGGTASFTTMMLTLYLRLGKDPDV